MNPFENIGKTSPGESSENNGDKNKSEANISKSAEDPRLSFEKTNTADKKEGIFLDASENNSKESQLYREKVERTREFIKDKIPSRI